MNKNIYKIENTVTLKIKAGYYLKILTPETLKLLRSTKSKIIKDKKWWKCSLFRNCRSSTLQCC